VRPWRKSSLNNLNGDQLYSCVVRGGAGSSHTVYLECPPLSFLRDFGGIGVLFTFNNTVYQQL
jgi:hypothetical protein